MLEREEKKYNYWVLDSKLSYEGANIDKSLS